jgi:hypothetical protein
MAKDRLNTEDIGIVLWCWVRRCLSTCASAVDATVDAWATPPEAKRSSLAQALAKGFIMIGICMLSVGIGRISLSPGCRRMATMSYCDAGLVSTSRMSGSLSRGRSRWRVKKRPGETCRSVTHRSWVPGATAAGVGARQASALQPRGKQRCQPVVDAGHSPPARRRLRAAAPRQGPRYHGWQIGPAVGRITDAERGTKRVQA